MTTTDRKSLEQELVRRHGAAQSERIRRGLDQVQRHWRRGDGSPSELARFALNHFISDEKVLADTASRLEAALEALDGHANEVQRELTRYQALDEGPTRPIDALLASYSAKAHVDEDLFRNRIAFVVLLNFPLSTLEERLRDGAAWSRERWALARLAGRFEHRLPPEVIQEIDRAGAAAETYIDGYNIHVDRLRTERTDGRLFPEGKKLISHWGLRDEIGGLYAEGSGALARQRLLVTVMERIIRQEIPAAVIGSPELEWDPERNLVRPAVTGGWRRGEREKDVRYAQLLSVFKAMRRADPYFPDLPSHIQRSFSREREIPEARLRALLESVLLDPVARRVGTLIAKRLGRPLEPFDLWYPGFKPKGEVEEAALDRITKERYPTVKAFQDALPRILGGIGFSEETAAFLAERIVVDPARGAGHALGAKRRDDRAHLRTRVAKDGLDYKGYNIAIHELGHNVEQVFSMSRIDHTLLEGVPNTGFTEAFAFLFQARDLELLGQAAKKPGGQGEVLQALSRFWSAYEIAGVALLDLAIWHWLYSHPRATPVELRDAVVQLAKDGWNRYYAPVFGVRDQILPAIYSHIIAFGLYTPDYPLGYLITFQVERFMRERRLAEEMERMCRLGRLAPDVWMKQAVGSEISSAPLLEAARAALETVKD
jgi:hypothetical protein